MADHLPVRVIVRPLNGGPVDHDRVIDQYLHQDRVWLARTAHWAMHNGRMVTSYPADADVREVA